MDVKSLPSVEAAVKTLSADERQKVFSWFSHLENWENDAHTRSISKPTSYQDVQVLNTSDDIRIFFTLDPANHVITILEIAKPSRFEVARPAGN